MKKSVCIEKFFLDIDFYDRIKIVAEEGIEYIEFWSFVGKDMVRMKELCQKYNIKIASFSGDKMYSPIIKEDMHGYLDYLHQAMEVAKTVNCKYLVVHSNGMDERGFLTCEGTKDHYEKKIASMTLTFTEAVKIAEREDITLVFEAINTFTKPGYFVTRTEVAGDIARVIESSKFKILYDIWHMQQMEGNIIRTLREYIDVLGYIHIGDAPDRHEPGTGEINFPVVKEQLMKLGYNGFYGLEYDPALPSRESIRWEW